MPPTKPARTTRPSAFVDTSAYVALLKRDDDHHQDAVAILHRLTQTQVALFTSNFILAETHAMCLRYLGHEQARTFLQSMENSKATIVIRAEEADEDRARKLLYKYADKDFSLTDGISFVLMERLGIRCAFTFDQHFSQYGFEILKA
jgi:uncharacterized protein